MRTPEAELYEVGLAVRDDHRMALALAIKVLEGRERIKAPHHRPLCDALDAVVAGRIKRLIVSVSPGFGKTLSAVIALMARGLLLNPRARFLHLSYGAELALANSARVRELLMSEEYRAIGAPAIRDTSRAKGLWQTESGGEVRAVQTGGGVTGFRAGRMGSGFTGAIILDDPSKPDLARSRKQLADSNLSYNTTISSRLAHEDVPIIVIQQRLAAFHDIEGDPARSGDMSEFLLRGGSGEQWNHLELPAVIDNAQRYPSEWTHGRPIAHGLPDGPLWPAKLDAADCARLERANPYVWAAQYQQRPKARAGDSLIRGEWFGRYDELPTMKRIEVFADTASKTGERHDYSVFLAAGLGVDDNLYALDVLRSKWTVPELHAVASDFWSKWREQGARSFSVEDANSGTYLVQALGQTLNHTVKGIRRTRDKFSRVSAIIEPISSGRVLVPRSAPWVSAFVAECEQFSDDDSHAHDDQVDCLADAVEALVLSGSAYSVGSIL